MKVTVCQLDPRSSHLQEFLNRLQQHVREQQTDFLLLPEMCFSDWLAADAIPDANRWQQAVEDHDQQIGNLADFGVRAVMGTRPIVKSNGSRRNQAYLWSADTAEAAAVHEKYYLPDEEGYWEHSWYDRGPKSFDLGRALDMRIGVQICTEMWFFDWARHYGAARADLLCVPRATPHDSTDKWLAGGQASAVCSGAYCLSSNLWAPEGERLNAGGLGWIVDPEGEILATTSVEDPFATVEIDLEFSRSSKATYPRYVPE
jgi:N-carbamoylputrescine amidase